MVGMRRGSLVWTPRRPLAYILSLGYSSTSRCPTPRLCVLVRLIRRLFSSYSYWLVIFTCLLLVDFLHTHGPRVSFLTHPVSCHVTLLWYIVRIITCLYLSFLLSRNPTLLDHCVFADKLGCLKSFHLRGTLSW